MSATGDCYESAGMYIMDECMMYYAGHEEDCPLVLVHAEVSGQGAIDGVRYGHAFVLDGDMVIDKSNGRDVKIPKIIYYSIGNIGDPYFGAAPVWEYTFEEARDKILEYGHWGPWDLETESGL